MEEFYYHAGASNGTSVVWSDHTRKTFDAARREARRIARELGGFTPLVEKWRRSRGLRPQDLDAVLDCVEV